jgi:hypothetical protein
MTDADARVNFLDADACLLHIKDKEKTANILFSLVDRRFFTIILYTVLK